MREDRSKAMVLFGDHDYLLRFWNELTDKERAELVNQFTSYKMFNLNKVFKESGLPRKIDGIEPIDKDHHAVAADIDADSMNEYWNIGLEAIAKGELVAIVLAGGQATRLGAAAPKGCLSLGFNMNVSDSLFAIQAARIARLQDLARAAFPASQPRIWWFVMTSEATEKETAKHLAQVVPAAGLHPSQVIMITQGTVPCFDINGGLFLSSKSSFVVAPNGNGGLFQAMAPHLPILGGNQIKYFHVYCVDNVLCRVADPYFIGYCIRNGADCAAKAVEKVDPAEKVGVICKTSDGVQVVEYSELPPEFASAQDDSGHLKFRAGNIANHFFTYEFFAAATAQNMPFHRAFKKIPFIDRTTGIPVKPESENGYKLERFVFDVFKLAQNFHIWEVKRSEEFSPLKNAESTGKDCMSTCRRDYYAECKRWLEEAGVPINADQPVYIHPHFSYCGEGLEVFRESGVTGDLLP